MHRHFILLITIFSFGTSLCTNHDIHFDDPLPHNMRLRIPQSPEDYGVQTVSAGAALVFRLGSLFKEWQFEKCNAADMPSVKDAIQYRYRLANIATLFAEESQAARAPEARGIGCISSLLLIFSDIPDSRIGLWKKLRVLCSLIEFGLSVVPEKEVWSVAAQRFVSLCNTFLTHGWKDAKARVRIAMLLQGINVLLTFTREVKEGQDYERDERRRREEEQQARRAQQQRAEAELRLQHEEEEQRRVEEQQARLAQQRRAEAEQARLQREARERHLMELGTISPKQFLDQLLSHFAAPKPTEVSSGGPTAGAGAGMSQGVAPRPVGMSKQLLLKNHPEGAEGEPSRDVSTEIGAGAPVADVPEPYKKAYRLFSLQNHVDKGGDKDLCGAVNTLYASIYGRDGFVANQETLNKSVKTILSGLDKIQCRKAPDGIKRQSFVASGLPAGLNQYPENATAGGGTAPRESIKHFDTRQGRDVLKWLGVQEDELRAFVLKGSHLQVTTPATGGVPVVDIVAPYEPLPNTVALLSAEQAREYLEAEKNPRDPTDLPNRLLNENFRAGSAPQYLFLRREVLSRTNKSTSMAALPAETPPLGTIGHLSKEAGRRFLKGIDATSNSSFMRLQGGEDVQLRVTMPLSVGESINCDIIPAFAPSPGCSTELPSNQGIQLLEEFGYTGPDLTKLREYSRGRLHVSMPRKTGEKVDVAFLPEHAPRPGCSAELLSGQGIQFLEEFGYDGPVLDKLRRYPGAHLSVSIPRGLGREQISIDFIPEHMPSSGQTVVLDARKAFAFLQQIGAPDDNIKYFQNPTSRNQLRVSRIGDLRLTIIENDIPAPTYGRYGYGGLAYPGGS